jgi:hypothetical protein
MGTSAVVPEPEGDVVDGPEVRRHALADVAVAPGGAADQHAVLVEEGDGGAIDLELGHVAAVHDLGGDAGVAALPAPQLVGVEGVVQGEHGGQVPDLVELVGRLGAHPEGGGVRGGELGVVGLELLQLAEQAVVLGVRDAAGSSRT